MTKELGKVFKLIRESKGLSQKEVAGNIISLAQLSRFERGVSGLSVESFHQCLENMGVPWDEFQFVYQRNVQKQDIPFSNELSEAYLEKNVLKLEKMLTDCQYLIEQFPTNRFYKLNAIVIKAVLYYLDSNDTVPQKEVQYLMDSLFSVEEWGRYELWLFTNSVGLMTITALETFTSEMLKRTQFYKDIPENHSRILKMLLNVIGICLEKGHLQTSFKFLYQLEQLQNSETDATITILYKYYKGYYAFLNGNEKGIADMQTCVEVMTFLESYGLAQQMTEEIKKLKKKYS